jgi:hypothetical protein
MNTETHERLLLHLVVILILISIFFYVDPKIPKAPDLNSRMEQTR